MKYYAIKIPYISPELRRSYNKQLEVYEIETTDTTVIKGIGVYTYKNKEWKYKEVSLDLNITTCNIDKMLQDDLDTNCFTSYNNCFIYKELEMAKIAKFLLIEKVMVEFQNTIETITKLMNKNMPNITEEIEQLHNQYPEYFI